MISPLVYAADYATALRMLGASLVHRGADSGYHDGSLAPVLLLPGVYEPWTFLRPLAERIHAAGHPVHVVRALGRNVRGIPERSATSTRQTSAGWCSSRTARAASSAST
jgi:triacylglycerol lipase